MAGFEDFVSGVVVIGNINTVTKGKETLGAEGQFSKVWVS